MPDHYHICRMCNTALACALTEWECERHSGFDGYCEGCARAIAAKPGRTEKDAR